MQYRIPVAWRAIAVLCYLSWPLGAGLVVPFLVWFLYKNRFLRTHAFNAGLIHLFGLFIYALFYLYNFLFIFETKQALLSYTNYWGQIFSGEPIVAGIFLVLQSLFFLIFSFTSIIRKSRMATRPGNPPEGKLLTALFLTVLIVPVLFFNNLFWPTPGSPGLRILDWNRFRDPLILVPGHLVLLFCTWPALLAMRGYLFRFNFFATLYIRLLRDERKRGEKRQRAATIRALILPGWGQFFSNKHASGLSTLFIFLLFFLFFSISLCFNYSNFVENLPGYNSNSAWYFLSELGLRAHIPDKVFKQIFSGKIALLILFVLLTICFFYSWWSTRCLYKKRNGRNFRISIPHSVLLHIIPLAIFFLIPVSFMTFSGKKVPETPIPIIPEFFEIPKKKMKLNGATISGNKSKSYGVKSGATASGPVARTGTENNQIVYKKAKAVSDIGKKKDDLLLVDERSGKDPHGGRPGDRREMTYSNYISARIRGSEKALNYWNRVPKPYSALFEYQISASGKVHNVRIREPSNHRETDLLTVELIRTMNVLLPPPGGGSVIITELFWNTSPGDENLPTILQRKLSYVFDGRLIKRF